MLEVWGQKVNAHQFWALSKHDIGAPKMAFLCIIWLKWQYMIDSIELKIGLTMTFWAQFPMEFEHFRHEKFLQAYYWAFRLRLFISIQLFPAFLCRVHSAGDLRIPHCPAIRVDSQRVGWTSREVRQILGQTGVQAGDWVRRQGGVLI